MGTVWQLQHQLHATKRTAATLWTSYGDVRDGARGAASPAAYLWGPVHCLDILTSLEVTGRSKTAEILHSRNSYVCTTLTKTVSLHLLKALWKCQITKFGIPRQRGLGIVGQMIGLRSQQCLRKKNWCLNHDFGREIPIPKWDRLEPLWNLTARVSIFSAAVSCRRNGNSFSIWADLKMNRSSMKQQSARCRISAREKTRPMYVTCMGLFWKLGVGFTWSVLRISFSSHQSELLLLGRNRRWVFHLPLPQTSKIGKMCHIIIISSPVSTKGARRNCLQMKWRHKTLIDINLPPGVSMAPRLLLNSSSLSLPSFFYRYTWNHISANGSWFLGIPSQDACQEWWWYTFIVRTLSREENGLCSKHEDSGGLENCSQEQGTTWKFGNCQHLKLTVSSWNSKMTIILS